MPLGQINSARRRILWPAELHSETIVDQYGLMMRRSSSDLQLPFPPSLCVRLLPSVLWFVSRGALLAGARARNWSKHLRRHCPAYGRAPDSTPVQLPIQLCCKSPLDPVSLDFFSPANAVSFWEPLFLVLLLLPHAVALTTPSLIVSPCCLVPLPSSHLPLQRRQYFQNE